MLIDESRRRQGELIKILNEMALTCMDDTAIRNVVIKFKALYTDGFRHNYSEFFSLIVEFSKDDNEYSLDYLSNNLQAARDLVELDFVAGEKEFKGLYKPLLKLSDHLNMEIGRYSYYSISEQQVKDLEKRNHALQAELKETTEKLVSATAQLGEAEKKIGSVQTDMISVLSIFAAIVLTFSGSISLLGNALIGMQETRVFKAVFFVLLCGFIFCNIIFLMMYLIGKLTGRNIYAHCKSKDCTCGPDGAPKCKGITRVRKRLPYVFWLNLTLILLMVADFYKRSATFYPSPGPGLISGTIIPADRHGGLCKFSQNSVGGDTPDAGTMGTERTKSILWQVFCHHCYISLLRNGS